MNKLILYKVIFCVKMEKNLKKFKKRLDYFFFFLSYVCKIKKFLQNNFFNVEAVNLDKECFMRKAKLLWKVAIIVLIATLSIAGLTSCGGAATEPTSFSSSGGEDNGGGTPEPTPEPEPVVYPESSYYTVKVPFANSGGYNATARVSYQDQEGLNKLWKAMMRRQGMKDGQIFYIGNRGGHNGGRSGINKTHYLFNGDMYFYLLDNMDICYQGVVLKKFLGAVIIPYANQQNTYTIGAAYRHVPSGMSYRYLNSDGVNIFMGWYDGRQQNDIDIVLMNPTKNGREFNGYGVDVYYKERGKGVAWGQDAANFLGKDPKALMSSLPKIEHFGYIGGNWWHVITFEAGRDPSGWGRGPRG